MRDDAVAAYLGLVHFYSRQTIGRALPVHFTELNGLDRVKPGTSVQAKRYGNAILWARMFATVLAHPDKVRGVSHHCRCSHITWDDGRKLSVTVAPGTRITRIRDV